MSMNRADAEEFLFREARLLDEGRLNEWAELLTDDMIYWVPLNKDDYDPKKHLSIIYENKQRVAGRVWRAVESGINHSQDPPSQQVRFVSNVEVETNGDEEEVTVRCNVLLYEYRAGSQRRDQQQPKAHPLHCQYRLRRVADEWKISFRKVSMLTKDAPLAGLTFIL